MSRTKIYFASDIHLGLPAPGGVFEREKLLVKWLDMAKTDAKEIFLVGDIFDFWYEYKMVVPKGFTRFLGKVAEITDSGIPVHFFTGNHDVWMFDYFPKELGVTMNRKPIEREFDGKRFLIAHGDGLGPGDIGYKFLKSMFTSKVLQWLFSRLHPNFSLWFGNRWSVSSRYSKDISHKFRGEQEIITKYSRQCLEKEHTDFFVFGHWHSPIIYELSHQSNLVMLGDWIVNNTYACWDGVNMTLSKFNPDGTSVVLSKR
jgi:UDP-2,3-diacylglucosamine hydrolase